MNVPSIGYWCSVASHQYLGRLKQKLAGLDAGNWYYVLLVIDEGAGRLSQQELADRLRLDKVSMTRALDQLSERGYVERCDCEGDRRKRLVRLTPKARPAVRAIRKAYEEINEEALKGLKKAERAAFLEHMALLVRNLGAGAPPVRMNLKRVNA